VTVADKALDGLVTVKTAVAVPETLITCGELGASSIIEMVSLSVLGDTGAKTTPATVQLALAASVPQAFSELVKLVMLLPPATTLEICRGALPELVTVTLIAALDVPCNVLGKFTVLDESVTAGPVTGGPMPVPVRVTTCGLPGALSMKLTVACRAPAAAGVKVTAMEQDAFAAIAAPMQLLEGKAKSPGLLPPTRMVEIFSGAVPELVTITLIGELVVPSASVERFTAVGLKVIPGTGAGAPPEPASSTDCGLPGPLSITFSCASRTPAAAGVNTTEMKHELAGASTVGAPQLSVSLNSLLLAPVMARPFTLSA
jgi:hypothetical protein